MPCMDTPSVKSTYTAEVCAESIVEVRDVILMTIYKAVGRLEFGKDVKYMRTNNDC